MSHMKEVAKILGVEIGEEFKIKDDERIYKLDETSAYYKLNNRDYWKRTDYTLTNLLSGKLEIIKVSQPILDDVEKRYLSNVIKPFRDDVKCIIKNSVDYVEWITICMKTCHDMDFPIFDVGTMYKGMELDKEYKLEELEL